MLTTEGVRKWPSRLGIRRVSPLMNWAIRLLVVPKSMPICAVMDGCRRKNAILNADRPSENVVSGCGGKFLRSAAYGFMVMPIVKRGFLFGNPRFMSDKCGEKLFSDGLKPVFPIPPQPVAPKPSFRQRWGGRCGGRYRRRRSVRPLRKPGVCRASVWCG